MKKDKKLLKFYLEQNKPEAKKWNISLENLYLEYTLRKKITEWVKPKKEWKICNARIGVGEWDDYLRQGHKSGHSKDEA